MAEETKPGDNQKSNQDEISSDPSLSEKQIKQAEKASSKDAGGPKKNMHIGKKRTLREKWRLTSISNKIISIATVVIAGASLLQFGTAIFQWLEMRDAGTQTEKIITADERIAKAMENSVTQAQISFNAANKQAILSQRAWMQVKVGIESPTGKWTVGKPLDVRMKRKNTGRTPALNVKDVNAMTIQEKINGVFKSPPFSYKPEQYVRAGNLTPDGEIFSDFVEPFTAEDENRIVSEKVRVYVHGVIEYDDVFGVHHWLTYCNFLLPGQAFAICPYHNEVDQNDKWKAGGAPLKR